MSISFITNASYQDMAIGLVLGKGGEILISSYKRGALAFDSPTVYLDELKNRPLNAALVYGGGFVGYLYFWNLPTTQRILAGLVGGIVGSFVSGMI